MRQVHLSEVASIAVLRANAMGDYLMAEPALAALRSAAPGAHITLLGGDFAATALPGRPGPVDEVVLVPYVDGVRNPPAGTEADPQALSDFCASLRARGFDLALQMHGGGRNSTPIVSALGAGFTAGMQAFDAPPLDLSVPYEFWQHDVLRLLEVVAALGASAVRTQPHLEVLDDDLADSYRVVPAAAHPLVVIHPGATDPKRRWPADRFAQVADGLAGLGAQVVVVGTAEEVAPVTAYTNRVTALTDLSFSELVGLVARAELLVGNDSGPRHLADAVGTATVAVYWCGNMISAQPTNRARHRVLISWTLTCPVCGVRLVGEPFPATCCDTVSCVRDVPVDAVLHNAQELFTDAAERHAGG